MPDAELHDPASTDAPLDPALTRALGELAAGLDPARPALVALDFDGVLAPLQDDPEASRALPESVRALRDLAPVPGLHLALVSGRAIEDLADKAEVPDGTLLVGSHGAERGHWSAGHLHRDDMILDPAAAELHARLTTALSRAVAGSSARVEHKPASVVLHTRTATPADARRLTTVALDLGAQPGVDAMQGKDVVELSVLRVTKGHALAALRRELGATALLYAGDDVTDERAFAMLRPGDVTIKVGPGDTAARFRVADPAGLAVALGLLAQLLPT